MNLRCVTPSLVCLLLLLHCGGAENEVEIVGIEGIAHVIDPSEPCQGTVDLVLEKVREIDPFAIADVGMDNFRIYQLGGVI